MHIPETMKNSLWRLAGYVMRAALRAVDLAQSLRKSRAGRRTAALVARAMESRAGRAAAEGLARFADWALARLRGEMTAGERAMLDSLSAGRERTCLLRTRSRMDVGQWCNPWWGGAPLWLVIVENEGIVFAHGKRPYVERFALAELGASQYNAVMSEALLAASEKEALRKLRLPPVEGWQVIEYTGQDAEYGIPAS